MKVKSFFVNTITFENNKIFFVAIIQCTGDKIRNPEYPSHPDQCICPGDTEEKKENSTECSCPYGSVADPDDITICIGKAKNMLCRIASKRSSGMLSYY